MFFPKILIFALLMTLVGTIVTSAQTKNDAITIEKKGFGNVYQYHGDNLNIQQIQTLISSNPTAAKLCRRAERIGYPMMALSYAGGTCIGCGVARLCLHRDGAGTMLGVGVGLSLVSIGVSAYADKLVARAVREYYGTSSSALSIPGLSLDFNISPTGLGFVVMF